MEFVASEFSVARQKERKSERKREIERLFAANAVKNRKKKEEEEEEEEEK